MHPVVAFKVEHVHELDGSDEDGIFIGVLGWAIEVVLVGHGEAFVSTTKVFFLELSMNGILTSRTW